MDALFFYRHSKAEDREILVALRAIAQYAPWIRKIWVFGDRPAFLSSEARIIESVPHELLAWIGGFRTPVRSTFLMFFLTALLPELTEDYVVFSDDFILLRDWPEEDARRIRYLEDMSRLPSRGRGLWKDSLWRTYDTLRRLGYGSLNFETHVPVYMRKRWVLDAYRDLRDYVSEDRYFGLLAATSILNHAAKHHDLPLVHLEAEQSRAGFYGKPPSMEEIERSTEGRQFLNFDDKGFGPDLRKFLEQRFPDRCQFEAPDEMLQQPDFCWTGTTL